VAQPELGGEVMEPTQLYRHYNKEGRLLYVGISLNTVTRLSQHKGATWFHEIHRIDITHYPARGKAEQEEKKAIHAERPLWNKIHAKKDRLSLYAGEGGLTEITTALAHTIKKFKDHVLDRQAADFLYQSLNTELWNIVQDTPVLSLAPEHNKAMALAVKLNKAILRCK